MLKYLVNYNDIGSFMKKGSILQFIFVCIVLDVFISCSGGVVTNQPGDVEPGKVNIRELYFSGANITQAVSINTKEDAYVIKYNKLPNAVVPEGKSGYVKSSAKRSADDSNGLLDDFDDLENDIFDETLENSMKSVKNKFHSESKVSAMRDDFIAEQIRLNRSIYDNQYQLTDLEIQKQNYAIGDKKNFNAQIGDGDNVTRQVEATLKAIGKNCYVWFIDNNPDVVKEENFNDDNEDNMCSFQTLADKFDSIIDLEEGVLGKHTYTTKSWEGYINSFEKISIVVVDIDGDAPVTDGSYILGYFHPIDFNVDCRYAEFEKNNLEVPPHAHTNQGEIIYIDSHSYQQNAKSMYSTLVHEFNHLLNYVQKVVVNKTNWESWYTEMLAMICEDLFQDYLGLSESDVSKSRFMYFNRNYNRGFLNWDEEDLDFRVAVSYPNTYAFGAYLVRNFGGLELLHEMATNKFYGKESINQALSKLKIKKYGSNEIADFDYVLHQEPFILINANKDSDYSNTVSLNKWVGSAEDSLHFTPIVLKDFTVYYGKDAYTSSPKIYTAKSKGCVELGKAGFSINYVGKNLQTVNILTPENDYFKGVSWDLIEY